MAFLAMNRGVDIARDRLLDIFWPYAEPRCGRNSLKTALCSIRSCLRRAAIQPNKYLQTTNSIVRWTLASVDAREFEDLAASKNANDDHAALMLYRGDFLEGNYDNWSISERERLATMYESVLARVLRASKDPHIARRFIARNPYYEEAYAAVVEAALAARQLPAAAAWVERCRLALAEIGERPSAAFESRFKDIHTFTPCGLELAPAM